MKRRPRIFGITSTVVIGLAVWAYYPLVMYRSDLSLKWEGLLPSKMNFRDAGASINACAGREVLPPKRLFRSGRLFSGWSCGNVGDPDEIFSLDTYPDGKERFYCRKPDGILVGEMLQAVQLNDLEFLRTWDENPQMVTGACRNIQRALNDLKANKRVLIHCDAGRDRTGAVTALIAGYVLEEFSELNPVLIDAIECDYRKSQSLKPYKYGRIRDFLKRIQDEYGGVRGFLAKKCGV